MENANQRQIGGDHYRSTDASYQHWDLVADAGMGYFEGQITKYVCRWRKKNGLQDLEKALHYADKMVQLIGEGRYPLTCAPEHSCVWNRWSKFVEAQQIAYREQIVFELCISRSTNADLERLVFFIKDLIANSNQILAVGASNAAVNS